MAAHLDRLLVCSSLWHRPNVVGGQQVDVRQASLLQVLQVPAAGAARLGESQVLATVLLRAAGIRDAAAVRQKGLVSRALCVQAAICASAGSLVAA